MASSNAYEFGPFRLDAKGRVLSRAGQTVPLAPKVAETLLILVENAGELVAKEDLLRKLWPDTFVEEGSLARNISILRSVLEDGSGKYIVTVPKRGYRFSATVSRTAHLATVAPVSARLMLAVLPFENLSADQEQEYFSDGLTEEMITQLGRLNPEQLGVIARTSAMQYKRTRKTIQQIGHELNVSYVLEGSVRRSENRVRITAQLIQVNDQSHMWAESYDQNFSDILKIQSDIAQAVAKQIEVKLSPDRASALRSPSVNAEAYELCLKGRYFWYKRTEEGMRKGLEYFRKAIEQDPNCAPAYDGICDSYVLLACRGMAPVRETFSRAKAAARKALQIDPAFADAHASVAHIRLHEWDWDGLDEEFQRIIRLNPSRAIVYPWYSEYFVVSGQSELGIAFAKEAERLDPLSPVIKTSLVTAFYFARKFVAAIEQCHKTLEIEPEHFLPHFRLGQVCIQTKQFQAAIHAMEKAISLSSRSTETLAGLAQAYASAGMCGKAAEVVQELTRKEKHRYVSPYLMSKVFACLADPERTLGYLEQAYQLCDPDLIELRVEPLFDSLKQNPRFSNLLNRLSTRARAVRLT